MVGKWYGLHFLSRYLIYAHAYQNVHAVGDRANGIVLDAFEASLSGANVTALRPRLEHAQMMTTADMIRLGKLGGGFGGWSGQLFIDSVSSVIASVQPTHASVIKTYSPTRNPIVTFITF